MNLLQKFSNNTNQSYLKFISQKLVIFTGYRFNQNVFIRILRYLVYANKLLIKKGLVKSIRERNPTLKNNLPIPWLTHPFIEYISKLNLRNLSMVEFGSGNSTIFFSKIVKNIESFEYNVNFINYLRTKYNYSGVIHLVDEQYDSKINDFQKDIIFIDGFNRHGIVLNLLKYISLNIEKTPTLIIIDMTFTFLFNSVGAEYGTTSKHTTIHITCVNYDFDFTMRTGQNIQISPLFNHFFIF